MLMAEAVFETKRSIRALNFLLHSKYSFYRGRRGMSAGHQGNARRMIRM